MPDKCLDCPAPSADMDGFIVSGPGGAPRSEGSGVSSPEGPFVREAPQTGHVVIMGTLGADGNPGSLPDAPQVGWAYVAEDAGTYGGVQATEGDMVYCMSLNPTRWGVLQADSDDSGRDLVGVSAEVSCAGWTAAADAYGWEVEGLRYTEGAAAYGPDSFEFSEGTLTTVWTESMYADYMDAYFQIGGSEYHARADLRILFSGSPAAEPLGGFSWPAYGPLPVRLALDSVSFDPDPAAPGYRLMTAVFRVEERAPSMLSVSETLADGTVRTSAGGASCLDSAAVSVKADASCAGAVVPSPYAELSVRTDAGTSWYTDYMENLDCRSGSFVLGGAHTDYVMRSFSSAAYVRLEFELDGSLWRYSSYYNDFAGVFTGIVPAGTAFPLEPAVSGTPSVYSLVLAERTELTSENEGGPDVLVRFQLVRNGGPSVAVVAETLGGDVSVDTADLSCLNDRITSVLAAFRCSSAYAAAGGSSITVGTDMMYYADDAFPSDFCDPSSVMTASLAGGSFEIRGTDYDRMAAACSTSATFAFILDSGAFGRISANDFAQFFNGSVAVGDHIDSMNGRLRFVLNSRVELTSQDPGGPDIVVSLSVYEAYPALTLTSAKADGTSSSQTVDMSCLVPPVFDGSADGLVPANSPATQTADLLSDDGTWMRPATDAEIDALFA